MSVIKISVRAPQKEWSVSLQQPEIFIGRGGDRPLDIQIPDPTVSRCHGRVWLTTEGYWYEDNNSTHGSKKNEAHLIGKVRIFSGDKLRIGESVLTIDQADITESDLALNELFDVQVQSRLILQNTPPIAAQTPKAQIKVTDQRAYQIPLLEEKARSDTGNHANFIGNLVNIFGGENLSEALSLAIKNIVGEFDAVERGCILLLDNSSSELVVAAYHPQFEPAVSTTLAKKTMNEQRAFIWSAQDSMVSSVSLKKLNIKTGMYSPLAFGSNTLGMVCLDSTDPNAELKQEDLDFFVNISQVLSAAITAKKKEEA